MTSITSPESVEYLYFTDGNIQITADYLKISKVSKQISSIKWDDNERKEISIQNILPLEYVNCDVDTALKWVVSTIETEDKLGIEVANLSGIYRVKESLESLKILLLIVLWLDIDSMLDEILTTLHFYSLKLVDIIPYIQIYDDILRCHKEKAFQNILNVFLDNNYILSKNETQIINDVIQYNKLDVYCRYQLALKYQLPHPCDTITDQVTARKLYSLGIQTPLIKKEIAAVEETKLILADSISKYNLATRIASEAVPNVAGRHGLFWFHTHNVENFDANNNAINVGSINVDNVNYQVIIHVQENMLLSVSDFKEDINMITNHIDRQKFITQTDTCKYDAYEEQSDKTNYDIYYTLQNHDSRYRCRLYKLGLLTQNEVLFLKERDIIAQKYHRLQTYLRTPKTDWKDPKMARFISKYKERIHILRCFETEYYTSENGVKNENERHYIRKQFESMQYSGLIILLDMIDIVEIDHRSKYILIKKSRWSNIYYTHVMPFLDDIKTQNELSLQLPIYNLKTYMSDWPRPRKCVYNISEIKIDVQNLNMHHFYFVGQRIGTNTYCFGIEDLRFDDVPDYDPNYDTDLNTYYMVDPSTIDDIKEVIEKSNPYCRLTDYPRLVVAFPHLHPRIFFKAGLPPANANDIISSSGRDNTNKDINLSPYIHYTYDTDSKMINKVFRSNQKVCQSPLTVTQL